MFHFTPVSFPNVPFDYLKVTQRENKLPLVLSKNEVRRIIDNTNNLKHKAIISLIYSAGLRIGELLALKKTDIDYEKMLIHVRDGKGKMIALLFFQKKY